MDIYVTDLESNDRFRFPMLPQRINVKTGTIFQAYTVLAVGDIKLPAGQELTGFQWDGMLPGEFRKNEPYVAEWTDPKTAQSLWSVWRAKKKKLRLLITETPVNHDVYLERYTVDYQWGYGDYSYNISFIQAKDLKVYAVGEDSVANSEEEARPSPPAAESYTVAKGDSLYKIAQKLLGDGSRYTELFEANKEIIGSDPSEIYPGQVFTVPK